MATFAIAKVRRISLQVEARDGCVTVAALAQELKCPERAIRTFAAGVRGLWTELRIRDEAKPPRKRREQPVRKPKTRRQRHHSGFQSRYFKPGVGAVPSYDAVRQAREACDPWVIGAAMRRLQRMLDEYQEVTVRRPSKAPSARARELRELLDRTRTYEPTAHI